MKRCGVLYAGVGSFLFLAIYLRGSDSAYTTDQSWVDAFEAGLTWPWHLLQSLGIVG
jgi:hypothetical protein